MFGICILTRVMVTEREKITNTASMQSIHLLIPFFFSAPSSLLVYIKLMLLVSLREKQK